MYEDSLVFNLMGVNYPECTLNGGFSVCVSERGGYEYVWFMFERVRVYACVCACVCDQETVSLVVAVILAALESPVYILLL